MSLRSYASHILRTAGLYATLMRCEGHFSGSDQPGESGRTRSACRPTRARTEPGSRSRNSVNLSRSSLFVSTGLCGVCAECYLPPGAASQLVILEGGERVHGASRRLAISGVIAECARKSPRGAGQRSQGVRATKARREEETRDATLARVETRPQIGGLRLFLQRHMVDGHG